MKMNTSAACNPIQRVLQLNLTLGLFVMFCLKVTVLGRAHILNGNFSWKSLFLLNSKYVI